MKDYLRGVRISDGNVEESGLLDELRSRETYEKPTTERKRKKGAAKSRWRKKLRDQQLPKKLF
jgi:small subunit ribosomal protein S21